MSREKSLAEYSQKVEGAYRRRTPKSQQEVEEWASKYAPGGDYREGSWLEPYPTVMLRGDGCYLYDVCWEITLPKCWRLSESRYKRA